MGIALFFLVLAVTGFYAVRALVRADLLPGLTLVWGAHIAFFGLGVLRVLAQGQNAMYYPLGDGRLVMVGWPEYNYAAFLVALGLVCLFVGYYLPNRWTTARPLTRLDGLVATPHAMTGWAFAFFALALLPHLVAGINNPLGLLRAIVASRTGTPVDPGVFIMPTAGTAYSGLIHLIMLSYVSVAIVAYLHWRGRINVWLWIGTVFFVGVAFLSGTRHALVPYLLPFLSFARWNGRRRWFAVALTVVLVGLPLVSAIQLYARNRGFNRFRVTDAIEQVDATDALGGTELLQTASAIDRFGTSHEFLNGHSYVALLVNLFPRAWWADKPVGFGLDNAIDLGFNPDAGVSMSAGWVGEAYANGGWWVVILVGLAAGWLLRFLDNLTLTAGPFVLAVLFFAQVRFAFWVRGDSVVSLGAAVILLAMTFLFVGGVAMFTPRRGIEPLLAGDEPAPEASDPALQPQESPE